MTQAHTPGPWTAKNSPGAGLGIWADLRPALGEKFSKDFPIYGLGDLNAPRVQIAYEQWVQFPREEWEAMQAANARLIASAPDLLAALVDCVAVMDRDLNGLAVIQPELRTARAAIATATGAA